MKIIKRRYATILPTKGTQNSFDCICIDIAKNEGEAIVGLTNRSELVLQKASIKECLSFIDEVENVSFIITSLLGIDRRALYFSFVMSRAKKTQLTLEYIEAYPFISKEMYSKPLAPTPMLGFIQDRTTGDLYFTDELNNNTLAVIATVHHFRHYNLNYVLDNLSIHN